MSPSRHARPGAGIPGCDRQLSLPLCRRPSGDHQMSETTVSTPTELPVYMRREAFDPVPDLGAIREGGGVGRARSPFGIDVYVLTRHDDIRAALADATTYSNAGMLRQFPGAPDLDDATLLRMRAGNPLLLDPPEHTRLRRMLTPEFTVRRMRRLEPRIVEIVESALDDMERAGKPVDLVSTFALPIPSLVICELLGVPYADRGEFQQRTGRLLDVSLPMKERIAVSRENRKYMARLVEGAKAAPGEDMLGMLIREHGDDLSNDELIGVASLLLIAG